MQHTKKTVRISDGEVWTVHFEDGAPFLVQRTETVWSTERGGTGMMMSERVRRIIKQAQQTE